MSIRVFAADPRGTSGATHPCYPQPRILLYPAEGAGVPFGVGPLELVIVLIILLVIFGAKRLPEIGRGLGSSAREFKEGITGAPDPKEGEAISGPKPEDDKSA
jgi:sec-independent protein translocase protein TatA